MSTCAFTISSSVRYRFSLMYVSGVWAACSQWCPKMKSSRGKLKKTPHGTYAVFVLMLQTSSAWSHCARSGMKMSKVGPQCVDKCTCPRLLRRTYCTCAAARRGQLDMPSPGASQTRAPASREQAPSTSRWRREECAQLQPQG